MFSIFKLIGIESEDDVDSKLIELSKDLSLELSKDKDILNFSKADKYFLLFFYILDNEIHKKNIDKISKTEKYFLVLLKHEIDQLYQTLSYDIDVFQLWQDCIGRIA